jgi:hypothetical protein
MTKCKSPDCNNDAGGGVFCLHCKSMYRAAEDAREDSYRDRVREAIVDYNRKKANIPPLFADATFDDTFDEAKNSDAYRVLRRYAEEFAPGDTSRGVVVTGAVRPTGRLV